MAAWRPALSRTPTSSPPAWIGSRDAGGGVGDAGQQLAVAGLGEHPHPARERVEQRGVGHALDPPPGAGDRADAVAAASVAGREQHRVGAEQGAGRVGQPVQRAAAGRGRAEVVDRRGEGADRVELPPSLGVQLRRLDEAATSAAIGATSVRSSSVNSWGASVCRVTTPTRRSDGGISG